MFGYLTRGKRLNCPPWSRSIYLTPGDTGSRSCQFCGFTSASGHLGTQNTQAWWALQAEPVAVPRLGQVPRHGAHRKDRSPPGLSGIGQSGPRPGAQAHYGAGDSGQ